MRPDLSRAAPLKMMVSRVGVCFLSPVAATFGKVSRDSTSTMVGQRAKYLKACGIDQAR